MSPRRTLFIICLIVSVLCLASGFWIAGQWIGAVIAILIGPAWLLARKYSASRLPHICLAGTVGLAVIGRLTGSPPVLTIVGSALALAAWDLLILDSALGNKESAEPTRQYENGHIQSLTLALSAGLVVALLGRLLSIQIPFIVLLFCVAFILIALDHIWGLIKKTGKQ
jgi:hypothetical protein